MMIKEQVKALWKICFDDSEEFVESGLDGELCDRPQAVLWLWLKPGPKRF